MFEIIFAIIILLCGIGMCLPLSIMYWKDLTAQWKDRTKVLEGIAKVDAEAPDMEEAQDVSENT